MSSVGRTAASNAKGVLCLAALLAVSVMPARADSCYDVFGCSSRNAFRFDDLVSGPNCDFLYQMRNQIYKDHGYCFKTSRAIGELGNDGCYVRDVNALAMNATERANAVTILRAEQSKGCPQ